MTRFPHIVIVTTLEKKINTMEAKKEWPVEVFRKTLGRGWEKALVEESDGQVMATPCDGGVEIRTFRVRIRAFPKKDEHYKSNGIARAVRRKNTIYFPTRRGNGSIVLKFKDLTDCISFFDKLAELNLPNHVAMPPSRSEEKKGSNVELPRKKARAMKEQEDDINVDEVTMKDRNSLLDLLAYKDETIAKRRKTDAMSYIARLLHDADFLLFVNQIEESLNSTQDGKLFLQSFQQE